MDEPTDVLQSSDPQDPVLAALTQQSAAVTALVAHIAGGGDAMTDLHGSVPGSLGASTKGLQRRQKASGRPWQASPPPFSCSCTSRCIARCSLPKSVPQKEEELLGSPDEHVQLLGAFWEFQKCEGGGDDYVGAWAMRSTPQLMGDHRTCQEFLALLALALEQGFYGWRLEDSLSPHSAWRSHHQ